ncbi:hypothetical protein W822_21525 [Advenella kashmirensis W13003]|uniref:Amine oxidase domain-containing protein n=1 Tax=Advenella kashmirensis W13003 TaxID=1424334 RepID=V8QMK7_9BURK|nr:FAD-dependent oxidoreductase [Advenella kashmirensis]ETF00538.1 hypothetical protein W822_21525 [Advenella kashmirensis W13003]
MFRQTERSNRPRVAVVGAGWAGLAAAWKLEQAGCRTDVFEQAPVLGGRARKALIPRRNLVLDNGQHLMLGAYGQILALMQEIGIDLDKALLRLPLQLNSLNKQFGLRVNPAYPGPLRLPLALVRLKGLAAREKFALVRALFQLQLAGWRVEPALSVKAWLDAQRQPPALRDLFWAPLCIATLNTPLAQASMALFARVLKDSLGAGAEACDLILPRVDLSTLWPQALARRLTVHTNTPVRGITYTQDGYTVQTGRRKKNADMSGSTNGGCANGEHANGGGANAGNANDENATTFDAVVLATPPLICHRLLARLSQGGTHDLSDGSRASVHGAVIQAGDGTLSPMDPNGVAPLLGQLQAFQYHAIATLTVFLAAPFPLHECMYMLNENRALGHDGQWLFNRSRFMHPSDNPSAGMANDDSACARDAEEPASNVNEDHHHAISIVISHADHLVGADKNTIASAVLDQISSQLPDGLSLPAVLGHELIIEKRATFAATPQLARPGNRTPWPGLFLAGDWTDTGYPAVLEGAVMSGIAAAKAAHEFIAARRQRQHR